MEKNIIVLSRLTNRWWISTSTEGGNAIKTSDIKWSVKIGMGLESEPAISDGLVWVGGSNNPPRDPNVKGDAGVLFCFRESDGKFLYQHVFAATKKKGGIFDWPGIRKSLRLPLSRKLVCIFVPTVAKRFASTSPRCLMGQGCRKKFGKWIWLSDLEFTPEWLTLDRVIYTARPRSGVTTSMSTQRIRFKSIRKAETPERFRSST